MIDTDGLETLCAGPEEAIAHMRGLIEDLAVCLARRSSASSSFPLTGGQLELSAELMANLTRAPTRKVNPRGINRRS